MSGTGLKIPGVIYPFGIGLDRGFISGHSVVHKFGNNIAVGTSYVPVAAGGVWQTPQASGATQLRIKAGGNAADDASGAGARAVDIQGIDATGALITETLATAGASASAATTQSFMRVFRAVVSASGTYATPDAPSHVGEIVIEASDGSADWASILQNSYSHSQSQIGAYTVPIGYDAYLMGIEVEVEANKAVDILLLQRRDILQSTAPYSASRVVQEYLGLEAPISRRLTVPIAFPELTDFGFMAKVETGTARVSVGMEIVLVGK
jgi:hypothetical protein